MTTDKPTTKGHWVVRLMSWLGLAALFCLAVIDVVRGPWDHDGGYYLFQSALVSEGWRPYLDYESFKPPLMDLLNAIPIATGIDRFALAIVIPSLWIVLNTLASVALVRRFGYGWSASLLAGMGFIILSIQNGGNHVTHEHGIVLFTIGSLLFLTRRESLEPKHAFAVGLMIACATLSKQNGLLALLPAVAILYERRSELDAVRIGAGVAGMTLPFAGVLGWLGFEIGAIRHHLFERLAQYASASEGAKFSLVGEYVHNRPTAFFLALTLAVGLVGLMNGSRRLTTSAAFVAAVLQFLPRLLRDYTHYTLNVWPFALLLILVVSRARPEGLARITRAAATTIVVGAGLSLVLGQSIEKWRRPGLLASAFQPAAKLVREQTDETSRFRLYAAEPIVPFLAERLPDEIDAPISVMAGVWDGSHLADAALPDSGPVVLVDRGNSWVEPLRARLDAGGFRPALDRTVFDSRRQKPLRITVYLGSVNEGAPMTDNPTRLP